MWRSILPVTFLLLLSYEVQTARILGVFPIPSRSHQVVFRSYMVELAKKGHELVIISPEPFNKDKAYNITEIDVSFSYKDVVDVMVNSSQTFKRGVLMNIDALIEKNIYIELLNIVIKQFQSTQVQNFLKDKTQKFDLIVVEGFFEYQLIVSEIFKAPVILFPSFMGFPEHYEMMGAIGRHPILYPHLHRMNHVNLSLFGMMKELYYEYEMYKLFASATQYQDEHLKKNFGPEAPTLNELKKNVDMLFLNSYEMFANNRPVPPNVIYLGATHLVPAKEIPKDLKTYLDSSTRGVIYVSFGSNIRPSLMEKSLLDAIMNSFRSLPYDILWRFDGQSLDNVPENVKWQQWFPQRDLLFHPNIKAFVTQCGLQSTDEAIDAGVPLIGVPMMAEQWYNAQKYVDFGIGVKLDPLTLTSDDLVQGVKTVVANASYKENIKRLRSIFYDQPQTPLEKAVWWTEYVIRHGGAKHLQSPAVNMTWREYYMINIVIPIVGILGLVLVTIVLVVRKLFKVFVKLFEGEKKGKKLKKN